MRKIIDYFKPKRENVFIFLPLILVYIAIFLLNYYTPLMADDFLNTLDVNHNKINSISQIVESLVKRYYHENGRILSHAIGGILLMLNHREIAIFNSLAFCIFIYQIYKFIDMDSYKSKIQKDINSALYILIISLLIWKFTPAFGQIFLWRIGAANYLWTGLFILGSALSIRRIYKDSCIKEDGEIGLVRGFLYIILSFLAGSTNENPVIGLMVLLFCYMFITKVKYNKSIKMYLGMFVSMLVGYVLMLNAPGNFIRISNFINEPTGTVEKYLYRMDKMFLGFHTHILLLFLFSIGLYLVSRIIKAPKKIDVEYDSEIYILASLATYFSMIMSPTFPSRAMIITVIFLIIVVMVSINNIYLSYRICGYLLIVSAICVGLFFFINNYPNALEKNIKYEMKYMEREKIILESKENGVLDNIVVPPVKAGWDKYEAAFGLEDIMKDRPNNWMNKSISWYYGVNSVTLK